MKRQAAHKISQCIEQQRSHNFLLVIDTNEVLCNLQAIDL